MSSTKATPNTAKPVLVAGGANETTPDRNQYPKFAHFDECVVFYGAADPSLPNNVKTALVKFGGLPSSRRAEIVAKVVAADSSAANRFVIDLADSDEDKSEGETAVKKATTEALVKEEEGTVRSLGTSLRKSTIHCELSSDDESYPDPEMSQQVSWNKNNCY